MKSPLIERCPCCDSQIFTADVGSVAPTVKPVAITHTDHGRRHHTLKWQCIVCGAEWEHGQYEAKAFELEGK